MMMPLGSERRRRYRRSCWGSRFLLSVILGCAVRFGASAFQTRPAQRRSRLAPCRTWRSHNTVVLPRASQLLYMIKPSTTEQVRKQSDNATDLVLSLEAQLLLEESSLDIEGQMSETTLPNEADNNMPLIIMALCWGVAFLSALDRVAMSVAIVPLSQEFAYTETMKGQVSSLFSVGYGLAVLPCGLLIANASPRLVLAFGIFLWSVATLATPITADDASTTMIPLLIARASVGAAEAVVLPSIQRLMSNWISAEQKSLATAGIFAGFQAGTIAAYLVSPFVMEQLGGWRGLFYVYGGLGLAWLVPWFLLAQDSPSSLKLNTNDADRDVTAMDLVVTTGTDSAKIGSPWEKAVDVLRSAPWETMFTSRAVWGMTVAHAANSWGLYNNLSWTPTFYAEQYGLNVRDSAWFSVMPSLTGAISGLVAGATADAIIRILDKQENLNGEATTNIRKIFQGIALYGPALSLSALALHIPEQPWVAQTLLMGTVGLQAFNAAGYGAANQEKAGEKWTGLLYSLTSLPGVMVGSIGVYVTGQILDATQDWGIVYAVNALVNVIGATAFVTLYDSKREFD